jgi:glycosyltransferase 2 family protein
VTRSRGLQLANLAFWLLVAAASIAYVVPKWRQFQLSSRLSSLHAAWLAGAFLVLLAQYLVIFHLWRRVITVLGASAPAGRLFRAFALALLPRYVPGKVIGAGLRTALTAAAGVPYAIAVGSLFWELGLALAAATLLTVLGIAAGVSRQLDPLGHWLAVAAVAAIAVGLALFLIPRARAFTATWLHPATVLRRPGAFAGLFAGYFCGWILYAAAHWLLARALGQFPAQEAVSLLVALAASWTLGALSVFAPAGLGVREGLLFLFARGPMGAPTALLFVTLSRLLLFAVEVVLTLMAWMFVAKRSATPDATEFRSS